MKTQDAKSNWCGIALSLVFLLAAVSCAPEAPEEPTAVEPPEQVTEPPAEAAVPSPFPIPEDQMTPLDRYVAAEDPAFSYETPPAHVQEEDAYTARVYRMVSQEWLEPDQVDRPKWEHWMVIIEPTELTQTDALMFVGGGSHASSMPRADEGLSRIAVMTQSIVAEIKQIPNQRLKFPDEHDDRYMEHGRTEDEIIAYCWDKFMVTGDPMWLPRLPMTKAVVRAMDVVQKEHPSVEKFTVVGGSKRGWTTWTVGAVDPRVAAICPAVIDLLNMVPSFDHHFAAYGFWAPAISEYEDMEVLARLHTPEFKALCEIVDPYSYRDRLVLPKYIVNSTGDQFFLPDSWQFYFDDLKGEKHLRYVPNTGHGLNMEAYLNVASFHNAIINDVPRPEYSWRMEDDGNFTIECETPPSRVLLWQATNPEARDFRIDVLGPVWESTELEPVEPGLYKTNVAAPEQGWTGFVVELEFPNPGFPLPLKVTTGVSVLPETLPFPPPSAQ